MTRGERILAALAAGERLSQLVMIVVAHPDDETIAMGAQLCRLEDALLVHVTDGAPRDGEDARAYGFASTDDYAAARREELGAALRAGDAARIRTLCLDIPDKEAWYDLDGLTRRIAETLMTEKPAVVFTHAYEGGHPDHDAAAFAVHTAGRLIETPPNILEFPLYHRGDGRLVTGQFLPSSSRRKPGSISEPTEWRANGSRPLPGRREWAIDLDPDDMDRKKRMIDCFVTQRWLLQQFDVCTERFRLAPDYEFREPPHPGELHYETLGWGITGVQWRRAAAGALRSLGLGAARCP